MEHLTSAMRRLSNQLPDRLHAYWMQFSREFPDLKATTTVYVMPSLYAFDGQVRSVQEHPAILFGVDAIAAYRGAEHEFGPVFPHHEFFHVYHAQVAPEVSSAIDGLFVQNTPTPLYFFLWSEGLAIYASKYLNPEATSRDLLASASLADETAPLIPTLATELRAKLDSTCRDDIRDFFFIDDDRRKDFPARSGYYIGFLVVEELATSVPIGKLARLQGKELRREIEGAIKRLENWPTTSRTA